MATVIIKVNDRVSIRGYGYCLCVDEVDYSRNHIKASYGPMRLVTRISEVIKVHAQEARA